MGDYQKIALLCSKKKEAELLIVWPKTGAVYYEAGVSLNKIMQIAEQPARTDNGFYQFHLVMGTRGR